MKKFTLYIVAIFIIGGITLLYTNHTKVTFNKVILTNSSRIINNTPSKFIDTILLVGLNELDIDNIIIYIRPLSIKLDLASNISLEAFVTKYNNIYIIETRQFSRLKSLTILSHELLHIKQLYDNRLNISNSDSITWEGNRLQYLPEYMYRPWEIEAFRDSPALEKQIKKVLCE